jgi:hypothetical protein
MFFYNINLHNKKNMKRINCKKKFDKRNFLSNFKLEELFSQNSKNRIIKTAIKSIKY